MTEAPRAPGDIFSDTRVLTRASGRLRGLRACRLVHEIHPLELLRARAVPGVSG